ncbi:hypothetical protein JCM6292_2790 [Bacteroides pyogenes JCM 6292]|uniref:Uncharacterized protein n=2 Tax=Bacteroides pyogenes TaxID=310300 RepID=W4PL34_9BACE|nr:hypothetical protein JCM6292_2790 [Bacteroides pyogenes JCM 6292]GAE19834.1 hypothetical protein JCM6294_2942 [Bacteroides pyogenes DSM 20611 = JCM 6294]
MLGNAEESFSLNIIRASNRNGEALRGFIFHFSVPIVLNGANIQNVFDIHYPNNRIFYRNAFVDKRIKHSTVNST